LGLSSNLLPAELRSTGSRLIFVPTVILATVLGALLVLIAAQNSYYRSRYLETVNSEIRRLEPVANRAGALDKSADTARKKAKMLDDFRRRSKEDMDAISELTNLLAPPAWVTQLDITRNSIGIGGEAEQAAPLIKQIDNSKLFENSEFTMPIARVANGEAFRIRASREGVAKEPAR
jgi:general secretion pathway protein L